MRIAVFIPGLTAGGAEQVMLTLAGGFIRRGHAVDFLVVKAEGALLSRVPREARLIELGSRRVVTSVAALVRYLRRERPAALLSTLNTANVVAVIATRLARQPTRVAIRQASYLSHTLDAGSGASILLRLLVRWSYPRAHAVIAVSDGVAADLARRLSLPRRHISVLPNPIVTTELKELASRPLDDPWFAADAPPVILGVGRLSLEKRFDLLLRAFARVRQTHDARLVILGEGEQRAQLEGLVRQLRLDEVASLPGFVDNPFRYMARAKVFVLSSDSEGMPGALIQAVACGAAVIATDCESGPREVLQGGKLGRLVPVGNVTALASAICATLAQSHGSPPPESCLAYSESGGVDAYLQMLLRDSDG